MKIHAKYKTERGGWKFVKCPCCNTKRVFPSFKQAREYFAGRNISWKSMLV